MSRKSKKLLLASAVFSAGMLVASCGGGGGGGGSPSPSLSPSPSPSPSPVAKVTVVAQKGFSSPGALIGVYDGTVYDDGSVNWTEIPTTFDDNLTPVHEFSNRNVLLVGQPPSSIPYLFNPSAPSVTPISTCIDYSTGNSVPFFSPLSSSYQIYSPNFEIEDKGLDIDAIFTSSGNCLVAPGNSERFLYIGENYVVFGDGNTSESVYIYKKDGTLIQLDGNVGTTTVDPFGGSAKMYDRVEGEDTILIGANVGGAPGAPLYVIFPDGSYATLMNQGNSATGDDQMQNVNYGWARIIKDASGNYYVVAVDSTNLTLQYWKVVKTGAGSQVFSTTTPITNIDASTVAFALDGSGHLYAIADCDGNPGEYELIEGWIDGTNTYSQRCVNTPANDNLSGWGVLAFENGALLGDGSTFYHHIYGGTPTNVALNPSVISAVNSCLAAKANEYGVLRTAGPYYTNTPTEEIVGEGTNTIQCSLDSGTGSIYGWVVADGSGLYNGNTHDPDGDNTVSSEFYMSGSSMIFSDGWGSAGIGTASYVCTPGTLTSNGGCVQFSLSQPAFKRAYYGPVFSAPYKVKSDTNVVSDGASGSYSDGTVLAGAAPNVRAAYFRNLPGSPYIVDFLSGSVDTSTLNITFSSTTLAPTPGNISLELDRVANVYSPIGGECIGAGFFDYVWYHDATHDFLTLDRPANTCLKNVISVRPAP